MGARYAAWIRRRSAVVLVAWLALVLVAALLARRLTLRSGLEELLPRGDPSAAALDEARRRFGSTGTIEVVLSSPDAAVNAGYARELAGAIEALGPTLVDRAIWSTAEVRRFFDEHRWLYPDLETLTQVRDRLRYELHRRKNPLLVFLDEPPTLEALERRLAPPTSLAARVPVGPIGPADGTMAAVLVLPARDLDDEDGLLAAVQRVVAAHPAPAGVHVRYAGSIVTGDEEKRALQADMLLTAAVVSLLVALLVWLYFGQPRAVPLMALPALAGAVVAFGVAAIAFGTLNASTAFLGVIIVGNGINYPILTLARYDEERRRGASVAAALDVALAMTARATLLAATAAAVAYGSLALTRFRGFSQFGIIGGVGMLLCWVATMTLLPAALWQLDRRSSRGAAPQQRWRLDIGAPIARLTERAPWAVLMVAALVTVAAALALPGWLADPFEYDLNRLGATRRPSPADAEAQRRMESVVGRLLSPSLLLAPSPELARRAAAVVRQNAAGVPSTVERAVTVDDLLPGAPAVQQRKIRLLAEIRHLLEDPALTLLDAAQLRRLEKWRPPAQIAPVSLEDLPELVRRPFRERDGTLGRVVLIFPPEQGFHFRDGHDLLRLSGVIGEVDVDGVRLHAAGRAVVFAAMLRSIAVDGPRATVASLIGVALVTVLLVRRRGQPVVVLATLLLGVAWMVGVAALCDLRVNFLNFVALPITFGIGIDYAANLYLRHRLGDGGAGDAPTAMGDALRSTGGAVALNSATTSLGYGSILLAHSQALRSFGALAILGEVACLLAALFVLPVAVSLVHGLTRRAA